MPTNLNTGRPSCRQTSLHSALRAAGRPLRAPTSFNFSSRPVSVLSISPSNSPRFPRVVPQPPDRRPSPATLFQNLQRKPAVQLSFPPRPTKSGSSAPCGPACRSLCPDRSGATRSSRTVTCSPALREPSLHPGYPPALWRSPLPVLSPVSPSFLNRF